MSLSDAHHFRKMVAGACLIIAPLLFLASSIVMPGIDEDAGAYLANAADSPDAWYAMSLLALLSLVFVIPAALGLMHMLREREVAAGHVGGALVLAGVVALAAMTAVDMVVWQMTKGGDTAQMTALLDRVQNADGITVPLLGGAMAFALGWVVLAWGLVRARAIHPAIAGAVIVGALAFAVGFATFSQPLIVAAAALFTLGSGAIGLMVLRETDADWEHTPEFHGFRAAAGTP